MSQISQKDKLRENKQRLRRLVSGARRQSKLTDPFKRWMIYPNTNRPIRLDKVKLTDSEKALVTVLRQAAAELIEDDDKRQQRENEAMPLMYVVLFKWGEIKAEELLDSLLTYLRNIRREYRLSEKEIKAIVQKKTLTLKDITNLFDVDRHTVYHWQWKKKLKRDKTGKRFDTDEVLSFAKNLSRQKQAAKYFQMLKKER